MDTTDEMIIKISTGIIKDIMYDVYKNSKKFIGEKKEAYDLLGYSARKYAKKILENFNLVRVIGMSEPMPLKELYVRVNILKKLTSSKRISINDVEKYNHLHFIANKNSSLKTLTSFHRANINKKDNLSIEELINKYEKFIVLGKPGAGKTTLMKHITLMSIEKQNQYHKKRIPILIFLKDYSDSEKDLITYIIKTFELSGFLESEAFIKRILQKGRCRILFDGLDEVSNQNQKIVLKQLIDFSSKYSNNQIIISCRIAAYNQWFNKFKDVEIADFNEDQIEKFIFNWYRKEQKIGQECWKQIKENDRLMDLASIPLLLTLLCINFDENYEFPSSKADLYEYAIKALLKKWDSSRRIQRDEIYKNMSTRNKEAMLGKIAFDSFTNDLYFIQKRALVNQIESFILNLHDLKDFENREIDGEEILANIEAKHGILVERAKNIYSFSHLTFQEYFSAYYIIANSALGSLENLVNNYLSDDKWREVIILCSNILSYSDNFINIIFTKLKKDENDKRKIISKFLLISRGILLKQKDDTIEIATSFLMVLEFIISDKNQLTTLQNKVRSIINILRLQYPNIFDDHINIYLVDYSINKIRNVNLKKVELSNLKEELEKSKPKRQQIVDYLNGSLRLLECIDSGCYLSIELRRSILTTLFNCEK